MLAPVSVSPYGLEHVDIGPCFLGALHPPLAEAGSEARSTSTAECCEETFLVPFCFRTVMFDFITGPWGSSVRFLVT